MLTEHCVVFLRLFEFCPLFSFFGRSIFFFIPLLILRDRPLGLARRARETHRTTSRRNQPLKMNLAVSFVIRRNKRSPVGPRKLLVAAGFYAAKAILMPDLAFHLHHLSIVDGLAALGAFLRGCSSPTRRFGWRRSSGCGGSRRGRVSRSDRSAFRVRFDGPLGVSGGSREFYCTSCSLEKSLVMNVTIGLVIRRNKATPVGTRQLLVAFYTLEAIYMPDLTFHFGHLRRIHRLSTFSAFFRRGCAKSRSLGGSSFCTFSAFRSWSTSFCVSFSFGRRSIACGSD